MTFTQWEMMLTIYQQTSEHQAHKSLCNKKILNSLIKKGWIEDLEDGMVRITQFGLERAKEEIAPLY